MTASKWELKNLIASASRGFEKEQFFNAISNCFARCRSGASSN